MSKLLHGSLIACAALALSVSITGCSAAVHGSPSDTRTPPEATNSKPVQTPSPTPTPVSLDGKWKQTNSKSADAWQAATITGNTIEVDWVSDNGDTTSLYWAGSVTPPTTATAAFTWTSNNDTAKTETAMLASSAPTKVFTYDHGVISYPVSALGTTTTVSLEPEK